MLQSFIVVMFCIVWSAILELEPYYCILFRHTRTILFIWIHKYQNHLKFHRKSFDEEILMLYEREWIKVLCNVNILYLFCLLWPNLLVYSLQSGDCKTCFWHGWVDTSSCAVYWAIESGSFGSLSTDLQVDFIFSTLIPDKIVEGWERTETERGVPYYIW